MKHRSRYVAFASVLAFVLLLILWMLSGRSDRSIASLHPPARAPLPPPRSTLITAPSSPLPTPTDTTPTPDPWECPEQRQALEEALNNTLGRCEEEIRYWHCVEPGFNPWGDEEWDQITTTVLQAREGWMQMCPALQPDDLLYDCSEAPCLMAMKQTAMPSLKTCFDYTPENGPEEGFESKYPDLLEGWHVIAAQEVLKEHVGGSRALARLPARIRRLSQLLPSTPQQTSPNNGLLDRRCDEVEELIDSLDCETAMHTIGCSSEDGLPPEWVDEHIDLAETFIEDLEEDCPSFAESDYHLDCSQVPCVLVIPMDLGPILHSLPTDPTDSLNRALERRKRVACGIQLPAKRYNYNYNNISGLTSGVFFFDQLGIAAESRQFQDRELYGYRHGEALKWYGPSQLQPPKD